jgi:hypothetical protein
MKYGTELAVAIAIIVVMAVGAMWYFDKTLTQAVDACHAKGGVLIHSRVQITCVKKEMVIP